MFVDRILLRIYEIELFRKLCCGKCKTIEIILKKLSTTVNKISQYILIFVIDDEIMNQIIHNNIAKIECYWKLLMST